MPFNTEIHQRRSIRLTEYDYTGAGAYFVTVCSHGRECLFGEVVDEAVRLNEFGEIVREEWLRSAEIRKEIILDEFIIMPNHIHGIIIINNDVGRPNRSPEKTTPMPT
jgi:putative transposase